MDPGQHRQPQNARNVLVTSEVLLAEEVVAHHELPPRGVTTVRQLAVTCAGAFEFQVGRSVSWVDPTRLLFAEADQDFIDHHVVPGVGHRSVLIAPAASILDELSATTDSATEPKSRRPGPVRPCVVITMRSASFRRASSMIDSAGCP